MKNGSDFFMLMVSVIASIITTDEKRPKMQAVQSTHHAWATHTCAVFIFL